MSALIVPIASILIYLHSGSVQREKKIAIVPNK